MNLSVIYLPPTSINSVCNYYMLPSHYITVTILALVTEQSIILFNKRCPLADIRELQAVPLRK